MIYSHYQSNQCWLLFYFSTLVNHNINQPLYNIIYDQYTIINSFYFYLIKWFISLFINIYKVYSIISILYFTDLFIHLLFHLLLLHLHLLLLHLHLLLLHLHLLLLHLLYLIWIISLTDPFFIHYLIEFFYFLIQHSFQCVLSLSFPKYVFHELLSIRSQFQNI